MTIIQYDAAQVKHKAEDRWPEILSRVGRIDTTLLDAKHHPCPKCGGKDRFRLINDHEGAVLCNQCFRRKNGDGLAAVQWSLGCDFIEAVNRVAKYLELHNGRPRGGPRRIVGTFDYRDEHGSLLYQVVKYDPEDFRQRRPNGKGSWIWMIGDTPPVLYRLPELLKASPIKPVFIVEGEKDCDRLAELGAVATTNVGGAGKWKAEYSDALAGRRIVILVDNDDAGRKHADQVAHALYGKAKNARILELPDVPDKGDVSDWLDAGGTSKELYRLAKAAPKWEPSEQSAPSIILTGDLRKDGEAAWRAIHAANDPPELFRHGTTPARIEMDDEGRSIIRNVDPDRMRHFLARAASWAKPGYRGLPKDCEPPDKVVRDVLATPDLPLPVLTRVVGTPIFTADGMLETQEGYHPASCTYYAPAEGFAVPAVPEQPDDQDMAKAKAGILDHLLVDFPFISEAERATAVALVLLPFARELIDGPTPLHLFEKPSPGTGATLLVDMVTYPATGGPIATMSEGQDKDEWRKRITAKLMTGPAFVCIDNLRRRLDSAAVSAAITSPRWEDRILGRSEITSLPIRCGWMATGNNPAVSSEIARRTVRCRLDAKVDRPWLREGFRHRDLRTWTRQNRGWLVWSCLVLIRSWVAAERPKGDVKLGMFESWSETIGGILANAGIDGFLANASEFYDASDTEGQQWRALLSAWWEKHGDDRVTTSDLFPLAEQVDIPLYGNSERAQRTRFGKMLGQTRDRTFSLGETTLTVREAGKYRNAQQWKLEEC